MLARVHHGDAQLLDERLRARGLVGLHQSLGNFLRQAEILLIRFEYAQRQLRGFGPFLVLDVKIEQEFRLLPALLEPVGAFQELRGMGHVPFRAQRPRLDAPCGRILCIQLQRLVGQLQALRLIAARQKPLRGFDVGLERVLRLPHRVIQIRQANLNAKIVRLRVEKFLQQADRLGPAVALQMNFRKLQEQRPRLAHHALLDVQIRQLFERPNLVRRQFGDALVNSDGLGQEPIGDKNLGEALEVVDGLKRFALANIELADGHQSDLVFGFVLENVLVFADGLGDFALVQQLLRSFDVLAFAIGHARSRTRLHRSSPILVPGMAEGPARNGSQQQATGGAASVDLPNPCAVARQAEPAPCYANRRRKAKSTQLNARVNRQLSLTVSLVP